MHASIKKMALGLTMMAFSINASYACYLSSECYPLCAVSSCKKGQKCVGHCMLSGFSNMCTTKCVKK